MHGIINAPYNSESAGHWYDRNGQVVALVPMKHPVKDRVTGQRRTHKTPTITDARELGLFRSWSTVKRLLTNRALEDYWTTQMCETVRKMVNLMDKQEIMSMPFTEFKDLLVQQASEHREEAATSGSDFHGALAEYVKTHVLPANAAHANACQQVEEWEKRCGYHLPKVEVGFANPATGVGGTIDRLYEDQHIIADIKTVPTANSKRISWPYDDWPEQLAFYWKNYTPLASGPCRLVNLVIARETGNLVRAVVYGEAPDEYPNPEEAWDRARAIDRAWCLRNRWGQGQ